jgi:hypothetical protein
MSRRNALLAGAVAIEFIVLSLAGPARADTFSQLSSFTTGDLVVAVEGNITGNPANTVGDNQAAPISLLEFVLGGVPAGGPTATPVGALTLSSTGAGAISGEYGSSSEGTLQLTGDGKALTIMGYGIDAATYNANQAQYNVPGNLKIALGQTCSVTACGANAVPRVVAVINGDGGVDTTTAVYNVYNGNNPRSVYSADGVHFYISGQGSSPDSTGGVFYTTLGSNSATPITGNDTNSKTSAQDTRMVQIYNNTLYVSADSKEGSGSNRDFIGTLGSPPATSLFNSSNGPTRLPGFGNNGGTGKVVITPATSNGLNGPVNGVNQEINLSPQNFWFANANTLYVADSGQPKNDSVTNDSNGNKVGDGGLQKWSLVSGSWVLDYTISAGLNLVKNNAADPNSTSGTTGLYGLTGEIVTIDGIDYAELFATSATIGDLDTTYLYGIFDLLSATSGPSGESFTQLYTAPQGSNFKGLAFAPSPTPLPAALPLFVSGLGTLGLIGWRRRRKVCAAVA